MRVVIAAVGTPRAPGLADAIREYERRTARYWPFEVREVREAPGRAADAPRVRRLEGARLLAAAGDGALLVACDEQGVLLDTREFAEWLRAERERATRDVVFAIGGANGLDAAVLERARMRLALARWTLQHEIARLVLAEQLYRAGTLLKGEPYHK